MACWHYCAWKRLTSRFSGRGSFKSAQPQSAGDQSIPSLIAYSVPGGPTSLSREQGRPPNKDFITAKLGRSVRRLSDCLPCSACLAACRSACLSVCPPVRSSGCLLAFTVSVSVCQSARRSHAQIYRRNLLARRSHASFSAAARRRTRIERRSSCSLVRSRIARRSW